MGIFRKSPSIRLLDGTTTSVGTFATPRDLWVCLMDDADGREGIAMVDAESYGLAQYGFTMGLPEDEVIGWGQVQVASTALGDDDRLQTADALLTTDGMALWWSGRPLLESIMAFHGAVEDVRVSTERDFPAVQLNYSKFLFAPSHSKDLQFVSDAYIIVHSEWGRDPAANRRNGHLVAALALRWG